jgi:hypothetical protein
VYTSSDYFHNSSPTSRSDRVIDIVKLLDDISHRYGFCNCKENIIGKIAVKLHPIKKPKGEINIFC